MQKQSWTYHSRCAVMLLVVAIFVPQQVTAGEDYQLKVEVTGIEQTGGQIVVMLFSKKDRFPDKVDQADHVVKLDLNDPTHHFKKLKHDKYAVVVFHDLNMNGKVDKSALTFLPIEPLGLSNYDKLEGRPNFEKAKVDLTKKTELTIKLQSVGKK